MEYREDKPYWQKRLLKDDIPKSFDIVRFKNGYGNVPTMDIQFKGICFTNSKYCIPENGELLISDTIVIKLGKVLSITNHFTERQKDSRL